MIAAIFGESQDTWIMTTLLKGLEEWMSGFPSEQLIVVTDNKVVKEMAEARSKVASVVDKAPDKPHVAVFLNMGFPQSRLYERAKKLRIPTYIITGG